MLVGQTAINFAANVFSAAFGLINVMVFTRLFAPAEFGTYVLGVGFGTIACTFMTTGCGFPSCGNKRATMAPTFAASSCRACCSRAWAPIAFFGALLAGLDTGRLWPPPGWRSRSVFSRPARNCCGRG